MAFVLFNKINNLKKIYHKTSGKYISNINIFNLIILSNILIQIFSKNEKNYRVSLNSLTITIKIKASSIQSPINAKNKETEPQVMQYTKKNIMQTKTDNNQLLDVYEISYSQRLASTKHMFCGCSDIVEIDMSNFDASAITDMTGMFYECSSLTSVNFYNFRPNCRNMGQVFYGCKSLVSIDVSYLQIFNAKYIDSMFHECSSLLSVNFGTTTIRSVTHMGRLFQNCISLVSIDLSIFSLSSIEWMDHIFDGCIRLAYVKISNLYTSNIPEKGVEGMFNGVPQNIVLCYIESSRVRNEASKLKCITYECPSGDNYLSVQKKYHKDLNSCVSACRPLYYEYQSFCYNSCPTYPIKTLPIQNKMCVNCGYNCFNCSLLDSINNNLCLECAKDYYQIYNDPKAIGGYKLCYKNPEGYYLDEKDSFFKPCYDSCKICTIKGNNERHNCIKCKPMYIFEINFSDKINCYINCTNYHYTNINNGKSYCTLSLDCPSEYSRLIIDTRECVNNCFQRPGYEYEFRKKCYKNCPKGLTESNNHTYSCIPKYLYSLDNKTQLIEDIQEYLLYAFDETEIYKGHDLEINGKELFAEITTPMNQKLNEKNNINKTTINLGKCETLLRKKYNLYNKNDQFYILKIDVNEEGIKIPIIEYEIYYKNGENLQKLSISECEDFVVEISIPFLLDENESIDKYNASSDYYNNDCISSITSSGTDIILKDRQKEFIENNLTLCENNCNLTDYDFINKKVKCICGIKLYLDNITNIKIDKDELYKSFKDVKRKTNIIVIKCYRIVFTIQNLKNNIGFFIFVFLIIFFIICYIIFYCKYYRHLKMQIHSIILALRFFNKNKNKIINTKSTNNKKSNSKMINFRINNHFLNYKETIDKKALINNRNNKKIMSINRIKNNFVKQQYPNKRNLPIINKINNNRNKPNQINNSFKNKILKPINNNPNYSVIYKKILEYNDNEKNSLSYEEALKYDKRTYCQYYFTLIKAKNLFLFSFFPNIDYNSRVIKIYLFFFFFSSHLTINALFFDDDSMHKIYVDKGKHDIIYQLPIIVYSSLISTFINTIIKTLSLYEKDMMKLKSLDSKKNLVEEERNILKKLKAKFSIFFFINLSFLIIFGFFFSCFCGVFKNTQIIIIKDSSISFGLAMIYPFFFSLLPGICRIPALRDKQKNRSCTYKFSGIIEII